MNIAQFFDELPMIPNVEIVVSFLPEMLCVPEESARAPRFKDLIASASVSRRGSPMSK